MENSTSGKPGTVTLAMGLLWASLALGLVKFALNYQNSALAPNLTATLAVLGATLAVYILLIFMMSRGRNWARIAFLVLFVVGLVPSLPALLADFGRSPVIGGLALGDVVLQAWALILVFINPGKTWFQRKAAG
jgi:succinate-acetate transporter protein